MLLAAEVLATPGPRFRESCDSQVAILCDCAAEGAILAGAPWIGLSRDISCYHIQQTRLSGLAASDSTICGRLAAPILAFLGD